MSDENEQEAKQAAALRRALEEGVGGEDLPEDALEAAALIRFGAEGGELDPEAKRRGLEELLSAQERRIPARPRRSWAWIGGVASAAAIGLVLVIAGGTMTMRSPSQVVEHVVAIAIPRPSPALLRAQAEAASRAANGASELSREMRGYRRAVLEELARR